MQALVNTVDQGGGHTELPWVRRAGGRGFRPTPPGALGADSVVLVVSCYRRRCRECAPPLCSAPPPPRPAVPPGRACLALLPLGKWDTLQAMMHWRSEMSNLDGIIQRTPRDVNPAVWPDRWNHHRSRRRRGRGGVCPSGGRRPLPRRRGRRRRQLCGGIVPRAHGETHSFFYCTALRAGRRLRAVRVHGGQQAVEGNPELGAPRAVVLPQCAHVRHLGGEEADHIRDGVHHGLLVVRPGTERAQLAAQEIQRHHGSTDARARSAGPVRLWEGTVVQKSRAWYSFSWWGGARRAVPARGRRDGEPSSAPKSCACCKSWCSHNRVSITWKRACTEPCTALLAGTDDDWP
jgi:hypothetical protein